jgi:hypothetical protein
VVPHDVGFFRNRYAMSKPNAQADVDGGISVERTFGWGPEILALMVAWGGLLGIAAPGPNEGPILAAATMGAALVILGFRFVQRRHRLRVVAFPERNVAEIYSNGKLSQQVNFTSLAIVIQSGGNTFGPAFALTMFTLGSMIIALPGGAPSGLHKFFAAGAALLCGALLASHLRTRLLHRILILPNHRMLIPKPEAQQLGLEFALFMVRDLVVSYPGNHDWLPTLSRNLVKIGDQRRARGHRSGALAAYEESLSIDRKAVAADPTKADLQDDIRATLNRIGDMRLSLGDRAGAHAAYEESLAMVRKLVAADPNLMMWRLDLLLGLYNVATVSEPPRARAALSEALAVAETLARDGKLMGPQQSWPQRIRELLAELPPEPPAAS